MTDRPNTIPWPPLIVAAVAIAALALGRILPVPLPLPRLPGIAITAIGLCLDAAAALTMYRQRANILPHRAATALVTSGPFALSRNPIYLGNTILLIGLALALHDAWFLPAAALEVWLVTILAIRREEAHLAARFGPAWDDYRRRVPRWIRPLG